MHRMNESNVRRGSNQLIGVGTAQLLTTTAEAYWGQPPLTATTAMMKNVHEAVATNGNANANVNGERSIKETKCVGCKV